MTIKLREKMTILFQGDSITDAGRSWIEGCPLGAGYAYMIAARLAAAHPRLDLNFVNRGIGGNRAADLKRRWKPDCLDVKPDLLSIMIGVNDTWRRFDCNDPTTLESFYTDYHAILEEVTKAVDPILVLCEPFVLPYPQDRAAWREDLDPKIAVVRELAREFKAILVPFDGVFAAVSTTVHPSYWAQDGVHPSMAGHALMANAWLRAVVGETG